jgi:signal transduction histidine kinase
MRGAAAADQGRLLANGLVHKLRNVLNLMGTQLALLQKLAGPQAPPAIGKQLANLERSVENLEAILREYLAYASPEENAWEEVDLRELVGEVLNFLAPDFEAAAVQVAEEAPPDLPPVYVDRAKLKRALLNVLVNARQAMPEGGLVMVRLQSPSSGLVALDVVDTGEGVPEHLQEKVFEPFFTTRPGGLGLGLALVRQTVEGFGGRVTVRSPEGRGTRVCIELPTARRRRADLARRARRRQWLEPVAK